MSDRRKVLIGLHVFNGVTAVGGGLALMVGWIAEQPAWVENTGFTTNYFPGVILMAVVGGSALVAAAAGAKRIDGWRLSSVLAGFIMVFWIVGEVASIREFHFLQVIYLITGSLVLWLTPGGTGPEPSRRANDLTRVAGEG